ncbi:MAG: hypothetical protein HY815_03395, partial [Candidatus Riflebacteria bacterium]|nr:hypothetical protein [Candidatus Riflebacteria bacterium]
TAYRLLRAKDLSKEMEKEVIPQPGPPMRADKVVGELLAVFRSLPAGKNLWGFGQGPDIKESPSLEDATRALEASVSLRRKVVELAPADLEPEGTTCLLNENHSLRDLRAMANRLAEDVMSLAFLRQTREALDVVEAGDRVARIVGRGISGWSSLISKMICIACRGQYTRATAESIRRHFFGPEDLDAIDRMLERMASREVDLDPSVTAEYDMAERAFHAFDRRIGLLRYPLRLYWGDGRAQLANLRRVWREQKGQPPSEEISRYHIMLSICVPNCRLANQRYMDSLSQRQGLGAATVLERTFQARGSYPDTVPETVLDPTTKAPYRLGKRGSRTILYGLGSDGQNDGGERKKDVLIWE